jgi:F-type H+-transporting ATPase subunit b
VAQTREQLRSQVAALAVLGAEKILQDKVDEQKHASMLEQLAAKL